MSKRLKELLKVVFGLGLVSLTISCASTPKMTGPGFLGDRAALLEPGPKGGVKERWLKPGTDFKKYDKVILEHVVFFFADASEDPVDVRRRHVEGVGAQAQAGELGVDPGPARPGMLDLLGHQHAGALAEAERVGCMVGSGSGGLPMIELTHQDYVERGARRISPFFGPSSIINMISGHISIRFGFTGLNMAIVTACTTGLHCVGQAGPCYPVG